MGIYLLPEWFSYRKDKKPPFWGLFDFVGLRLDHDAVLMA